MSGLCHLVTYQPRGLFLAAHGIPCTHSPCGMRTHCQVGPVPLDQVSQAVQQLAPLRCIHAAPGRAQPEGSLGSLYCPVHVFLEDTHRGSSGLLNSNLLQIPPASLPQAPTHGGFGRRLCRNPAFTVLPGLKGLHLASLTLRSHRGNVPDSFHFSIFISKPPSFGERGTLELELRI